MRLATLLLALLMMSATLSHAQRRSTKAPSTRRNDSYGPRCPNKYLGLDFGINNPNGLVGLSLDVPIIPHMSVRAGIGRSSWGWKYFGEVRGYLGECHRSWAAGLGVSRNTGLTNFETELPTTTGDRMVKLDLHPQINGFVNLYKFWNIGKKNNRFHLMLGYSIPFQPVDYKVVSNHQVTDDGKKAIEMIAPHGVSIGVGFSFELAGNPN
jgi:hypothetical protein